MKLTVSDLRDLLRQFDDEEISTSRFVELINEKTQDKELQRLLEKAALGGYIISSSQCSQMEISFARAENRMYVNSDGLGYIVRPNGAQFPKEEKVIEQAIMSSGFIFPETVDQVIEYEKHIKDNQSKAE